MTGGERYKKLREEAERAIQEIGSEDPILQHLSVDLKKLLHELQVHQVELEMQNDELRRVQELLEEEKTKYTELFEYSPVGYLLMDKNGKILDINQTLCTLLKTTKSDGIKKQFTSFLNKDSQDIFYFHLHNLVETYRKSGCNIQIMDSQGGELWVKIESKVFNADPSEQFIIQSSLTDISANKRNEEHLLRLSTAFEQSANSIMITDINGRIEYGNPRFFASTGYSPQEIIGQNPKIIKYENSEIDYKNLWDTISSGKTWKGEFLNKNKFGEIYWELATITPVKNHLGKIMNYLAIKEDITQRKLAEKNLERAKDYYLQLLDDFPVMIWQSDTSGEFNFFNNTFKNFTGSVLSKTSIEGFLEFIFAKDREIFRSAFLKGMNEVSPFVVEFRLKDRYDNYRWVLNHAKPFLDMEGNYGGFIATCTDMHDRRIVEERLIESEDRYRRMFEDSSLGIFKFDRQFQFISANKAFAEMFGYNNTVDFLIDINNKPAVFFKDFSIEKDFRRNLVKSGDNRFVIERELYRKDRSKIYTLIHLRKVYERSRNKQYYMEGFIEDITTRKLSEKKLQVSEQKFKSLFEKSYDAILILDDDRIVDCNKKATEILQNSCKELKGLAFSELCSDQEPDIIGKEESLQRYIHKARKGEPQNFERIMLRNGKWFDAEISFGRIYMNNRFMVQAIVRDISEKKLVEKQLKQARDDAEKARMAQSEFLSLMSHEIRTPLNAVVSLTDLMLHEHQTAEQFENLQSVKISAAHLLGLIDDILDYNKIESGNIQFDIEDFNIRQLVDELRKVLDIKAQEKNIRLITQVDEIIPEVLKADTLRLKQVLFNMISNAIKFTEKGYVSLRIYREDEISNRIFFEVKDTGIGISADRLEAIFDKFTQEENSTSRKYGGSGLGLTICKKLVELQDGKIYAQSRKNEGSVFSFYIPMDEGIKPIKTASGIKADNSFHSLEGLRILMVEDDKMNQFVGTKIFKIKWKADLTIASSGEDALEILNKQGFDVILMDILLPGMDGYKLSRIVRTREKENPQSPRVPIIALTADAFVETRQKAMEAGMDDFISKPFDYESIFAKLVALLSQKNKR